MCFWVKKSRVLRLRGWYIAAVHAELWQEWVSAWTGYHVRRSSERTTALRVAHTIAEAIWRPEVGARMRVGSSRCRSVNTAQSISSEWGASVLCFARSNHDHREWRATRDALSVDYKRRCGDRFAHRTVDVVHTKPTSQVNISMRSTHTRARQPITLITETQRKEALAENVNSVISFTHYTCCS